jgi:hypothetical protein
MSSMDFFTDIARHLAYLLLRHINFAWHPHCAGHLWAEFPMIDLRSNGGLFTTPHSMIFTTQLHELRQPGLLTRFLFQYLGNRFSHGHGLTGIHK